MNTTTASMDRRQVLVKISPSNHVKLKMLVAATNSSIQDCVGQLIEEYIDKKIKEGVIKS